MGNDVIEIEEGEVVTLVVGIAVACTVARVDCEEGWFVGWDEGIKVKLVGREED